MDILAPTHDGPIADDLAAAVHLDNDAQYAIDRPALEAFQLAGARRRFEELRPHVAALRDQAERAGVTAIDTLDDIVPLLFGTRSTNPTRSR